MKFCYKNQIEELKNIIEERAKFQKVMLLYDESITNIELSNIYDAVKEICVFNQFQIEKIDENEIYNGYRLIIYLCGGDSYIKCNINRDEFINVFIPQDNCLLPFFLNENFKFQQRNDYLLVDKNFIDLQVFASIDFNNVLSYLKNLLYNEQNVICFNFNNKIISHENIISLINKINENTFFLDIEILKKCDISYCDLIFVDLILIDAFIVFLSGIKSGNLMLTDVYKVAKENNEMVDRFFKFQSDETLFNLLKMNYNFLLNIFNKTKQELLEFVNFFEVDKNSIKEIISKIKNYSKQSNNILGYLYLYDVFND